ncbi:cytochrome P450 [Rivularia sp. PCC 7116]|uniref:cytochrome P450 n=1 Tax=Rivularia sp. PCC 7116 TaxID=373994 RepID=UPI00029F0FCC|nr:cytochrome P450 [Rivularia sp. PCC 7116]AFY58376.1 cytochrome P450 [Rivularia sp. PCC 7116]
MTSNQGQSILSLSGPDAATAIEEYGQDPLAFMTGCARKYGEIVPIQLENDLFCLLTNPEHITQVLRDRQLFVKAEDMELLKTLLGNGLLTSEGSFWQRQRRLAQPIFHQRRINGYGETMVEYTQRMLENWKAEDTLDIHQEMMHLTLNIVMKTIFNQDIAGGDAGNVAQAVEEAMNWFVEKTNSLLAGDETKTPADKRYEDAIVLLDETVYAMIEHRRETGEYGNDLLGMLMKVEDADDGSRMTNRQLRDEVATLIVAGHETTANTLSWAWMLLGENPDIRAKLDEELKAVLQGNAPTIEDLQRLPYTTMVIKEALRLYPTVTDLSRQATEDCEIGGYSIPKGTTLNISQWVMHHDSRYFTNPEVFNPERWANDFEKTLPRGVYFPFGDGPRVCIGKSFAMMEAVLLLATIAQSFHLELVPNQVIEKQPSVTLRPKTGIQVVLKSV